ncbi:MAG: 4-hydroxy-tetrahydrodipicolinate reductase [Clostridia bacterium]|jgi:4-hydroxy-tetrahydrodipicolinate reductase|nr:4-hydroxy-tetrahydrodipicolinate reductase [Clostridia bacterium]
MNIIVNGAGGRMGGVLCNLIKQTGHTLAARVSVEFTTDAAAGVYQTLGEFTGDADCVIDFSNHTAIPALCDYCVSRDLPVVIATTGLSEEELACVQTAANDIPVFRSANMSLGVALLSCLTKIAAKALPDADIEIVEAHHNQKLDVPSGTALLLADAVKDVRPDAVFNVGRHENGKRQKNEIGIHSLRMGNEVGTHEVIFALGSQVITLKHEAENRALFAEGALAAAAFLLGKAPAIYTMDDIFDD